jgi:hypothetical protein
VSGWALLDAIAMVGGLVSDEYAAKLLGATLGAAAVSEFADGSAYTFNPQSIHFVLEGPDAKNPGYEGVRSTERFSVPCRGPGDGWNASRS